jgi:hypothetical protein
MIPTIRKIMPPPYSGDWGLGNEHDYCREQERGRSVWTNREWKRIALLNSSLQREEGG